MGMGVLFYLGRTFSQRLLCKAPRIQRGDERIGEGIDDRLGEGIDGRLGKEIYVYGRLGEGINERCDEGIDGRIGKEIGDGEVRRGLEGEVERGRQKEETSDEAIGCLCVQGGCDGGEEVCVSACLLAIRKKVRRLREELSSVKSELKDARE